MGAFEMQNIRASLGSGFQHASKAGINVDVLVFKTQKPNMLYWWVSVLLLLSWVTCGFVHLAFQLCKCVHSVSVNCCVITASR